ncbi:hypothetical protein INT44_005711 [Umbelopsis vinacea]|uniref:Uncharacterized protein n=1 Tax=Umbelopsis vinacea TaxID=44442 RepID=A0A8H7Q108_9FUNG|nr:hypothetical protein INT44_005711 [Umbelopsis vinacea]
MISLSEIKASNSSIASSLPTGLVAVFVGATSGIGEATLKQFAKYAKNPRCYFVGQSQEAADRIINECKAINSEGEYIFIKANISLIQTVDDVCKEIKSNEKTINLLYLSQGTLVFHTETTERLHFATALAYYSRVRFMVNLLPLLRQASGLRRVVTVFAAGKEGIIDTTDYQGRHFSLLTARGHASSMNTLSLEAIAKMAPEVSFVHDYPGAVKTNLMRIKNRILNFVAEGIMAIVGPFIFISNEECGDRHVYFATSARYGPLGQSEEVASGVPLSDGALPARGTNGEIGSGIYSLHWDGESSGPKIVELLGKLRSEGNVEQLWKHTEDEFKRITGVSHI